MNALIQLIWNEETLYEGLKRAKLKKTTTKKPPDGLVKELLELYE